MALSANQLVMEEGFGLLGESAIPVDYPNPQTSVLHDVVKRGEVAALRKLLRHPENRKLSIDSDDYRFGWSPLIIAAVEGNVEMAAILLAEGADPLKRDSSGWTAAEHAALRGHQAIWKLIQEKSPQHPAPMPTPPLTPSASPSLLGATSIDELRRKYGQNLERASSPGQRTVKTVETVGHRYLRGQTMLLVSLGMMDKRPQEPVVVLDQAVLGIAEDKLSLRISAIGAKGDAKQFRLPVMEEVSTDPATFTTESLTGVRLHLDVMEDVGNSAQQLIGRAVALLGNLRGVTGGRTVSLQGNLTLPIVAANALEVAGRVTFNFLVVTPFTHDKMSAMRDRSYWKKSVDTMLIGHRGLGKNQQRLRSLQLGENTIQSFVAAANLGANYVEFDVQLTKDQVPIIYHDFTVSETGIDAPVHILTLEQFMHINDIHTPKQSRPPSPFGRGPMPARTRAYSHSTSGSGVEADASTPWSERIKFTKAYRTKGFQANSRGSFIQAPFATLSQMFAELPKDLGFNIEVKYPTLSECEAEGLDAFGVELNSFVDRILATVLDNAQERNIIFSSFNPDVCLLLSLKQPCYPILFLTEAGTAPEMTDVRTVSLQEAIKFASRWGLLGIVSAAEPLCVCPRLIKVVKESGLICMTYGVFNNDTDMVRRQVEMGIDGVIVDSVLKVGQGLRTGGKERLKTSKDTMGVSPS